MFKGYPYGGGGCLLNGMEKLNNYYIMKYNSVRSRCKNYTDLLFTNDMTYVVVCTEGQLTLVTVTNEINCIMRTMYGMSVVCTTEANNIFF